MREKIKEYAKLLVDVGMNVQKGQMVRITVNVESAAFARDCAEAAYTRGCRRVIVDYVDDAISRMMYMNAQDDVFDEVPAWEADKFISLARGGCASLRVAGDDPEALLGVDPSRIQRAAIARNDAMKEAIQMQMTSEIPWCVGAVPTPAWARRVFPGKPDSEAIELLWDAIFKAVRVTGDGKATERWQEHMQEQKRRIAILNKHDFESLHYTNGIGTDLVVRLPENHQWLGGAEDCGRGGYPFVANMPTEEIFCAPHRDGVEGTVVTSMPFSLHGNVIDPFTFTFEKGKIIAIKAANDEQHKLLDMATTMDEGASHLGEVALVPYASPIRELGILFYNTLFDENAACHFAFGEAYASCVRGSDKMSEDERVAHGINTSKTHIDFMVGTKDLSIVGTTKTGEKVPVFIDGNFAF